MSKPTVKVLLTAILAAGLAGCAGSKQGELTDLQSRLAEQERKIEQLNSDLQTKEASIEMYQEELEAEKAAAKTAQEAATQVALQQRSAPKPAMAGSEAPLLPPNAKSGECFARVFVAPTYKTITEKQLIQEAAERVEVVPAKYAWAEEKIVVKEASTRLETVPAQYKTVEEKVLVQEAGTVLETVPAQYKWVEEKVLVKEAHTAWKKGRGLIEKVDDTTGEIMCLIEVPAQYKTVKKQVLVKEATTREVAVPAKYKTVTKRVLAKPATTREIPIPAEYNVVKVKRLVAPAKTNRVAVPAEYQTVTRTELVSDGRLEWRRVLCETNASRTMISQIQTALAKAGYNPGPADGIIGAATKSALKQYQLKHNLSTGGLTYETIEKLGIKRN